MLDRLEQQADQWMTEMVEQGTDDQVFASGYLQGHLALSLNELDEQQPHLLSLLSEDMDKRISAASSELAPDDLNLVRQAWLQLLHRLQQLVN
ncbi:YfcL protein [Ferrimonas sediminum]|uniref:YfcL protein n=1 Tax=Ferrimonas sediminum TaxID=718193 RepID=A0A1G8XXE2_9GAMM|nr:YfcL family protein [Ferrimonas sediminum]SDJ94555.1 YfcL protein [Ferrimonas sediminum]